VIAWSSAGANGFKGSRKSTPFAAQMTAEAAARRAQEHGLRQVDVFVRGPGSGREMAIRSLQSSGISVSSITDTTPDPLQWLPSAEASSRLIAVPCRQTCLAGEESSRVPLWDFTIG
jgi:hypothetical protein